MDAADRPLTLTESQRRVLWLLSTGRTSADIARESGKAPGFMRKYCARIHQLMGASTAAHAVRNGLLNGHIGPYEDCGTLAAYRRHIKRDEPICPACKRGNLERLEAEAARRLRRVELTKPQHRLLLAMHAGRTRCQIASAWGVSEQTVKELITSLYCALGVDRVPVHVRREAAMREARIHGLLGTPPPPPVRAPARPVKLSKTHIDILVSMGSGVTLAQTARDLNLRPGTCSTRLSEAYRLLDVGWMDKGTRLPAALRKARELGLLPEPAPI